MVTIDVTIDNVYEDETITRYVTLDVDWWDPQTEDEWEDWAQDEIFPETGTGREDGEASYFARVTCVYGDDSHPLTGAKFEWGT